MGSQNVTKCIDGIYTSDYNISFYDIEHDGVINYQSAYQLIQQSIDGSPTSLQRTTTISSTPTESQTIGRPKGMICITITYEYYLYITDGGISSKVIAIIVMVIIIVIVTVLLVSLLSYY